MKIIDLRKRYLATALALGSLLLGMLSLVGLPTTTTAQVVGPLPTFRPFFARSYGGKCLDFGGQAGWAVGAPVFIYTCNGTIAQQIDMEEIDPRPRPRGYAVLLHAGTKVIGVRGNALIEQAPLELQDYNGSAGQVFELDGDSIILAADRNLVVEVQRGRGANRTPLVLGRRDLNDAEFWTFTASDGSNRRPTRGFVRVSQTADFVNAVERARWGTVIEVDPDASINLDNHPGLPIPAGVTIRGDRRGTHFGPELRATCPNSMLAIAGKDVRITGLRLRGPSRSTSEDVCAARGIIAYDSFTRSIIDHNDMSDWTNAAIEVWAVPEGDDSMDCQSRGTSRPEHVRVVRNFIHHNQQQGAGYGVGVNHGAYTAIEGNTFVSNRHAIKGGGEAHTGYRAWFNLVLADAPKQHHLWHTQDFDVHGTGGNGFGGRGGEYFEIARNTFLGTNRANFDLRGEPCYMVDFHHNISLRDQGDAVDCTDCGLGDTKLSVRDNQFESGNPTNRLGVGDFDGDGIQDLFLATGTAWYYAPWGNAEWRYLNAQTDGIGSLLFGDFDDDGRTDVFTQHGNDWDVSWAGASVWEKINASAERMSNFAVGDFVGDKRADVFYTDGQTWYISDGGGPFTPLNTSSFRIPKLRFGDFDNDGKTDVFSVVSGQWMVSYSGLSGWQRLRSRLSDSVANLIVADFNGDGYADVATAKVVAPSGWRLQVSYGGTGNWTPLRTYNDKSFAAIGRFDDNRSADVLLWQDNYLAISAGGSGVPVRQSRQDMR